MIPKNKFIEYMEELEALNNIESSIDHAIKNLSPDFCRFSLTRHESLIVNILQDAMDDKYDWIPYWLYDLDCGKDAKADSVTHADGSNIPIRTAENLYDLLRDQPAIPAKTAEDIPVDLPMADLVYKWAQCSRSSEAIWGVINFLSHFKKEEYGSRDE